MDTASAGQRYGGFAIGAMALALPMAALREVVPADALTELPCPARCVVGALLLRGVSVPVVCLRRLLGKPADQPGAVVILMVHDGRMLGLLADNVTGVFQADAPGLHPVQVADATAAILAGSVCRSDDGTVAQVLAPAALAALAQVPMAVDPEPGRQQQAAGLSDRPGDGRADTGVVGTSPDGGPEAQAAGADQALAAAVPADTVLPMLLVRCGHLALAVDAMVVHATLPRPRIEPSVLAHGHCLGVIDHDGQAVPAVDLLGLTGLGRFMPGDDSQAFLILLPQGLVALMISQVMDVARTRPDDLIPVPAFALPQPGLFAGALPVARLGHEVDAQARELAPQYLVLDGQALRAWPDLVALASTSTRHDGQRRTQAQAAAHGFVVAAGATGQRRPMIIYELHGETATPIDQVVEILPFNPDMANFQGTGTLLGMVAVRGRMIPVMCLSGLVGLPPPAITPAVSVLVVESDGELVGFAVPRLVTIDAADWEPALPTAPEHRQDALGQLLNSRKLAQMGHGTEQRMLRVLELRRVAQALQQRALAA